MKSTVSINCDLPNDDGGGGASETCFSGADLKHRLCPNEGERKRKRFSLIFFHFASRPRVIRDRRCRPANTSQRFISPVKINQHFRRSGSIRHLWPFFVSYLSPQLLFCLPWLHFSVQFFFVFLIQSNEFNLFNLRKYKDQNFVRRLLFFFFFFEPQNTFCICFCK